MRLHSDYTCCELPLTGANLCSTSITPMALAKSGGTVLWGIRKRSVPAPKIAAAVLATMVIRGQPVPVKCRSPKVHQAARSRHNNPNKGQREGPVTKHE